MEHVPIMFFSDPIGRKISKHYFSNSFQLITTKLHDKYAGDRGILAIKFLELLIFWDFDLIFS